MCKRRDQTYPNNDGYRAFVYIRCSEYVVKIKKCTLSKWQDIEKGFLSEREDAR